MAPGPLLQRRETRLTDRMTVARLVLLQKPVADQQRDTTFADLDWRGAHEGVMHGRWMLVRGPWCN